MADNYSSGVRERLLAYLKYKNLSQLAFCNSIGVSSTYVSSFKNGFSQKILEQIHSLYPDLNILWLLFGEGDMTNELLPVDMSGQPEHLLALVYSQQRTIGNLSSALQALAVSSNQRNG